MSLTQNTALAKRHGRLLALALFLASEETLGLVSQGFVASFEFAQFGLPVGASGRG